jgi:hypothetical protein
MTRRTGRAIAALGALRPTQMSLGMLEVREKMDRIIAHGTDARGKTSLCAMRRFVRRHRIRVIVGPGGDLFIAGHHHWARALLELGWRHAPVKIIDDLGALAPDAFWRRMRTLGHLHPFDEHGKRRTPADLPPTLAGMRDDPYRSLAAFVRLAGAYRKPGNAYGDFTWANFLRAGIHEDMHSIAGFARAMSLGIRLAQGKRARRLPGYLGPLG